MFPQYHLVHPAELIAYRSLELVGGVVSLAFCKGLLRAPGSVSTNAAADPDLQPAMGGLLIGIILIFFPQVHGCLAINMSTRR